MRIVTIFLLIFIMSAGVFSQPGLVNFNYQISYPIGETSDFIDKVSFRGVGLEWRKGINKNIQMGISLNWNVFNQVVNETAEIEDGHVTGTQNRTINSFPLLVTGHYYFGKRKSTRPYFGLGLGAYLIKERLGIGVYTFEESNWHFGVAPELGVQITMGYEALLMLFARYNHAFETKGAEHSYVSFHIAIATEVF